MLEQQILENEQVIYDAEGQPEYVVLPFDRYAKLLEMLENAGLGQAMLEAEPSPRLTLQDALADLDSQEEESDEK